MISTKTVDNWCIPLGIVIGPCTIASNGCKLVWDAVKLVFSPLFLINYVPTSAYLNYKEKYETYKNTFCVRYEPFLWNGRTITTTLESRNKNKSILDQIGKPVFREYQQAVIALRFQDRIYVEYMKAKKDAVEHITFVGIGAIRTIPLFGGIARSIWNIYNHK